MVSTITKKYSPEKITKWNHPIEKHIKGYGRIFDKDGADVVFINHVLINILS